MDTAQHGRRFARPGRLTWIIAVTVVGAVVATGVGWATAGLQVTRTGPAAQGTDEEFTESNAQWTGTVYGSQDRKTTDNMVSATYAMRGTFWFRVDDEGKARGYANVVYEPSVDLKRMDAAIKYVRDSANASLGMLTGGPILTLATSAAERHLATYTGLDASPERKQLVLSGPISGTLKHGELDLGWASEQQESIGFDVTMKYLNQDEKIVEDKQMPLEEPWLKAGKVSDNAGAMVESVYEPEPAKGEEVTITTTSTWTAHRVGG